MRRPICWERVLPILPSYRTELFQRSFRIIPTFIPTTGRIDHHETNGVDAKPQVTALHPTVWTTQNEPHDLCRNLGDPVTGDRSSHIWLED